ncbi:tyrosine-type recombinase/integrase [Halobellus inordinatus]|uniref:tyrosine-type recombinase/integrase n=1 Tax=Halobellus inordinatus TaxID=1126236 RepID=UPI002115B32A|nr:tyrosine-type recombinase/integrase [Halobellus ramosii]
MGKQSRNYARELERIKKEKEDFVNPDNAEAILHMAKAYDEDQMLVSVPEGEKTNAPSTLENYVKKCRRFAKDVDLLDTSELELRELLQQYKDGEHHSVKDDGLTNGTLRLYSIALRKFYKVHTEAGINEEEIPVPTQENTGVDPDDMLTREEIQELRGAARNNRDLALFDFLIYTGQRASATRTLKIKNLKLEQEQFCLNEEEEGLKGADKNGKWRDLLLSAASIRQWLQTGHPNPDDPEAYVFTPLPSFSNGGPYKEDRNLSDEETARTQMGESSVYEALRRMKDRTDVEKPLNPHSLRHNFVTISLRRGVPESAIKHQLGHAPESQVMESTYAHLKDSDHIREARKAFDLDVEERENEATPTVCPRCGENPPASAKLCPWCGLEFTLDAQAAKDQIQDDIYESKGEAEGEEEEAVDEIKKHVKENIGEILRENPEIVEEALSESEN